MIEVPADEFQVRPFHLIGREWMLIAAEKEGAVNAMTASWGGLGVMWGKNVAFIVIRPQRHTRGFVDAAAAFSLNFFDPGHRDKLNYFGTVSGRDEDKIAKTGLRVARGEAAPYFEEARDVLVCRKLYAQTYRPELFIDRECDAAWYPEKDYHQFYIAEVVRILSKRD